MKPKNVRFNSLEECRSAMTNFGFTDSRLREEIAWNSGYELGRARWSWGPAWMVSLHGWVNTQIGKLKKMLTAPRLPEL